MIVKILSSSATFNGVKYNTDKIDSGKGELLKAANFGALEGLSHWRPQDFKNYLKAMSSRNKLVSKPQFHAVISAKGQTVGKADLLEIAGKWMDAMGYGKQPYLVVFHNDTGNNHVHIVTTRIDWNGRKINDSYENLRSIKAIREIMRQDVKAKINEALGYRFSTIAQLQSILQSKGHSDFFKSIDPDTIRFNQPSSGRASQLNAIFRKYAKQYSTVQLAEYLKTKMGIELIFHSKDGKPAYGYTVLDHAQKNAYKGSEVMPLKELLNANEKAEQTISTRPTESMNVDRSIAIDPATSIRINIANDIDDEAINGPRRYRKKKARTNLR